MRGSLTTPIKIVEIEFVGKHQVGCELTDKHVNNKSRAVAMFCTLNRTDEDEDDWQADVVVVLQLLAIVVL